MLLQEKLVVKGRIIESDVSKLPVGVLKRGIWSICNIGTLNQNNRMYERGVFEKVINDANIKGKMDTRTLFGQAEHPEKTQSDLQLTSHVITRTFFENVNEAGKPNEKVFQEIDILDTPAGRIINTLIEAGCQVGVSTRAEGDLEEKEADGKKFSRVIPESYHYVTTDFTADPSTYGTVPMNLEKKLVTEVVEAAHNKDAKERLPKNMAKAILEKMTGADALLAVKLLGEEKDCKCGAGQACGHCGKCNEEKGEENKCSKCGVVLSEKDINEKCPKCGHLNRGLKKDESTSPDAGKNPEQLMNWEMINLGVGVVVKEGTYADRNGKIVILKEKKEGKIKAISESAITVDMGDGAIISVVEPQSMTLANVAAVNITAAPKVLPTAVEPAVSDLVNQEEEEHKDETPGEAAAEEELEIPEEEAEEPKNPFESVDERTLGTDNVKDASVALKAAKTKLKDKDYEAAAKALDDVADEAKHGATSLRKMKRNADAKAEADKNKPEEKKEEKPAETKTEEKVAEEVKPEIKPEDKIAEASTKCSACGAAIDTKVADINHGMCQSCFEKTPKAKEEKGEEEAAKKAQEAKITEAFDDMVKYMEEKLKGMAPEKITEFGNIVKTKLLNEKITPSIVAKEIRGLKIAEAAVRAERDKAMELIDGLEVEKTTIEESKKVENSILVKKLQEAIADIDSISKLLEAKQKLVSDLNKQLNEVTISSKKEIKKIQEQSKVEVEKTKQNLSESSGKKVLESYVGMKLNQSGLKVSTNARALLEKCTTIESVDETLEDLKDAMRKDALRPGKIDSIKIEETKQKVSEAKTLTTAVQTLMGSMR